jgi:hypothetical protein
MLLKHPSQALAALAEHRLHVIRAEIGSLATAEEQ